MNSLKKKLKLQKVTFGSWITIPDINIVEIFSNYKFDWLCIDMEHSSITIKDIPMMTSIIKNNNISPLVRVGEHNSNLIKRVMDCGADGVIVADVRTIEQAKNIINSVKYPPIGNRGVGLYKAQKYGKKFNEYKRWLQEESIVIPQIEHHTAIQNLKGILSLNDVDAIMVGPYDMSGSIGIPGEFKNLKYNKILNEIRSISKKLKKPLGIHSVSSNPKDCRNFIKKGYKFIGCSLDTIFLMDSIDNYLNKIKK